MTTKIIKLRRVEGDWWQLKDVNDMPVADVMGKSTATFLSRCLKHREAVKKFLDSQKTKSPPPAGVDLSWRGVK